MKKLFFNRIFLFSVLALGIGLMSLLADPGCKKSESPGFEQPVVNEYYNTINFPGRDWSDVTFLHKQHSDQHNGSCFKCHNCVPGTGNSNWNCRSCHNTRNPESLCSVNDSYHGCTYMQCYYCHEVLRENEGHTGSANCNYCHTDGQLNAPILDPVLELDEDNDNNVILKYSNTIDQVSAELEINYTISGTAGFTGNPSEALRKNNKDVYLTIGDMTSLNPGETVIVTVTGVKDINGYEILDPNIATYGENNLPEARNVGVNGTLEVGETLTGFYTYYDIENDLQSGTILKWYRCDDLSGSNQIQISVSGYTASGAGSTVVNGFYSYYGICNTSKNEGVYTITNMPIFKKNGTNYYLGYRGCSAKWIILEILTEPTGSTIGGGPGNNMSGIYYNSTDSFTVPGTGWAIRHSSSAPGPTLTPSTPTAYTLTINEINKYIKFEVTPFSSTGNSPGVSQSVIVGPVAP